VGLVFLHVVRGDVVVSLAKTHVSLNPVDKAYEDSTEDVHKQYTQGVAPKGEGGGDRNSDRRRLTPARAEPR
jgi:hypothetical protein